MQRSTNSFFKFFLGFTLFVGISLGLTFAVTMIEIEQEKEEQTALAFNALVGREESSGAWWEFWK